MGQDLPAKDDHHDILTELSPPAAPAAPTWTKRPTPKIAPLHRMQWAPRPSALFVGKDLGIEDEGDDAEPDRQGREAETSPKLNDDRRRSGHQTFFQFTLLD